MLPELLLLAAAALAAEPMCEFVDQPWGHHQAFLTFPDTDTAFAHASSLGTDARRLDATLEASGDRVRMRATLRSPDVVVSGDIDPDAGPLFYLLGPPLVLGEAATMLPGGGLSPGPAEPGHVLVRPVKHGREAVTVPAAAVVPCERISTSLHLTPPLQVWLQLVGLPFDPTPKRIPEGKAAPLRGEPDGEILGEFLPAPHGRTVYVVEKKGRWSRVAWSIWGTVWHGWTETSRLEPSPGGGGVVGPPIRTVPEAWRVCGTDVALWARVGEDSREVGIVRAGTRIVVEGTEDPWWIVDFPDGWLGSIEGSTLRVPVDGVGCPEVPAG